MAMGSKARPVARCIPEDGAYANWEVELAARHLLALSEMRSPSEPLGSFDQRDRAPGIECGAGWRAIPVQLLDRLQTAAAAGTAGCSGPVAEDGRGSDGR
jgi:hypothetical protein